MTRRDFIKALCLGTGSVLLKGCGQSENVYADGPASAAGETDASQPAYGMLEREGKLAERVEQAYAMLEKCELCPRRCGVNRRKGELGFCRAPDKAKVASHSPHYGEERPLVGRGGSGTIFFSNCNFRLPVMLSST